MSDSAPTEFADTHQANLYDEIKDKPLHVEVVVLHKGRTQQHVIERELLRVLKGHSLDEIKEQLLETQEALEALNIFQAVELTLEPCRNGNPEACTLQVKCPEKRFWHAHAGTYLAETEAKFEGQFGLTSPFGYAERIDFLVERSSKNSTEYALQFAKPRTIGNLDGRATLSQQFTDRQQWSSYVQNYHGSTLSLASPDGRHTVGYELAWRALSNPNKAACQSVRQQAGNHLKSALQYSYQWRRGDCEDPGDPDGGLAFRSTTEVAGVGMESSLLRFARQHLQAACALPTGWGTSLFLQAQAGLLVPWGPSWVSTPTCIGDRFFLGGVNSLRGFHDKQAGPSEARLGPVPAGREAYHRDALGGDVYATIMAALRFQFPHKGMQALGIHGHVFVNGGNLSLFSGTNRTLHQIVSEDFTQRWRWTAGIGVRWQTTVGTLEINACQVLAHQQHDRPRFGLQFGVIPMS